MSNKTHLRQTMLDLAEGRLRLAEQTYARIPGRCGGPRR